MNFPDEILNLIFSFREKHPIAEILKQHINKYLKYIDDNNITYKFKDWILRNKKIKEKMYILKCKERIWDLRIEKNQN
jgi:hypothetical protein